MTSNERWPYLCLVAGHIFYLGDPAEFHEIDRMELDRTEDRLRDWIKDIAGELDDAALKARIRVTQHHRIHEATDAWGMKPLLDYVFLFDRSEVLIEEVLSSSPTADVFHPPIRIRRFKQMSLAECSDEIRSLFSEE